MASTSETGHAKNVANLQDLISFVTGYGAPYNPTKSILKLSNLIILQTNGQSEIATVVTDNTGYNNTVNERFTEFSTVKSLSTRLVNALDATDASSEKMKDAKAFNRKLQGKRASVITEPINPATPAPQTISSSQQSYDQQIQHLAGLNSILISEPSYAPNESELTTTTVTDKINKLTAKNHEVADAYTKISNSRISRDKTLYGIETGLVDVALEVKKYVKSLFGANSPEYAQVKGIEFKRAKK